MDTPDWIRRAQRDTGVASPPVALASPASTPDWLSNLTTPARTRPSPMTPLTSTPEWLGPITPKSTRKSTTGKSPKGVATPVWLRDASKMLEFETNGRMAKKKSLIVKGKWKGRDRMHRCSPKRSTLGYCCQALTNAGRQCRIRAEPGSQYCRIHGR